MKTPEYLIYLRSFTEWMKKTKKIQNRSQAQNVKVGSHFISHILRAASIEIYMETLT